jgi:hypothetical protein
MHEGLFVYTSPFAEGTPYISFLISYKDFKLPLYKKMVIAIDFQLSLPRERDEHYYTRNYYVRPHLYS